MWIYAWDSTPSVQGDKSIMTERTDLQMKRQTDTCLPSRLTSIAPQCAISCIQAFVKNSFGSPSCDQSSDLNFLCRTISLSGYTIGEGGFQCLLQACGLNSNDVYNVCSGITGSRPKTHATITATITSATAASSVPNTANQAPTITTPPDNTLATDTSTPPNFNGLVLTTANAPFPVPSSAVPSSNSSPAPGKTAGIAVGSAAGAFGLIGLMLFFCRRRRRDQIRRRTLSSPMAEKAMSIASSDSTSQILSTGLGAGNNVPRQAVIPSPVETITAAVEAASAGINTPLPLTTSALAMTKDQRTRSYWRNSIRPEEIGVAVTPTEDNEFFRKSQGSNMMHVTKSIMPLPDSAVLPSNLLPTRMAEPRSVQIGERGSYVSVGNDKEWSQDTTSTDESGPLGYKKELAGDDIESQFASPSPPRSASHSVLASARASLVGLGTMLVRSMSLKRQPSDSKPLLKPTVYSGKVAQPVNKYSLTPKYDNGNFDPKSVPSSVTTSPEPVPTPRSSAFMIPRKPERKPTFSSFISGKLLPTTILRSSPPVSTPEQQLSMPQSHQQGGQSASSKYDSQSSYGTTPLQWTMDRSFPNKPSGVPAGLSGIISPGMRPAPLTIRKSQSSRTIRGQSASGAPSRGTEYPPPALPLSKPTGSMDRSMSAVQAPQKAMEVMGLGSPVNAQYYARKPLPVPSHPPNEFINLVPVSELDKLSAAASLANAKATELDQDVLAEEDTEPPVSAATSWLSVPVSTQPPTARGTIIKSPPSNEPHLDSFQSLEGASPRGRPGFPSLASSLTSSKYSASQLPTISPTSAIVLSATAYKPPTLISPPVPPMPDLSSHPPVSHDSRPLQGTRREDNESNAALSSDQDSSGFQSNLSSPQRFTRFTNPYNPYFPASPARQKSTSTTRSQNLALSSHPTPAVPQLAYPLPTSPLEDIDIQQTSSAYFRTPSLRPSTLGPNGSRQTSSLLSPDSADPRRESAGFTPKVVVTPNKLPGGDLVLTVDTSGKGYGV